MSSNDDWSDSDSELDGSQRSGTQTSVLLGIPDGSITADSDIADPTVSRGGGIPPFFRLKQYPEPEVSNCKVCSNPMELLVSIFCPFEGSANDRVLYVWGCSRARCQRKEGSTRAFRCLQNNAKWARKLERQRQKEQQRAAEEGEKARSKPKPTLLSNPFSAGIAQPSSGLGDLLFGSGDSQGADNTTDWPEEGSAKDVPDGVSDQELDEEDELASQLESTTISSTERNPEWATRPSYPPFYISTSNEYISAQPAEKLPKNIKLEDQRAGGGGGGSGGQWIEQYEKLHQVDEVFEKFVTRIRDEPEQVIRYDLAGVPLAYNSRDAAYKLLFPATHPPGTPISITNPQPPKANYDPSRIPACPLCSSPRAFECQLMPNLLNLLRRPAPGNKGKKLSAEERRRELEELLRGGGDGMGWGTIMVFSCVGDCCIGEGGDGVGECWREEYAVVQWE